VVVSAETTLPGLLSEVSAFSVALFLGAIRVAPATLQCPRPTSGPGGRTGAGPGMLGSTLPPGRAGGRGDPEVEDARTAVVDAAAAWLGSPDMVRLQGVTGVMAVAFLVEHINSFGCRFCCRAGGRRAAGLCLGTSCGCLRFYPRHRRRSWRWGRRLVAIRMSAKTSRPAGVAGDGAAIQYWRPGPRSWPAGREGFVA
jgi:hypothetical protein